jgi:hypothetical protein
MAEAPAIAAFLTIHGMSPEKRSVAAAAFLRYDHRADAVDVHTPG